MVDPAYEDFLAEQEETQREFEALTAEEEQLYEELERDYFEPYWNEEF